jgi:hypothetical protein
MALLGDSYMLYCICLMKQQVECLHISKSMWTWTLLLRDQDRLQHAVCVTPPLTWLDPAYQSASRGEPSWRHECHTWYRCRVAFLSRYPSSARVLNYHTNWGLLGKYLFLRKPGGFQWSALALRNLEPSYACVNFFLSVNSVSWWQEPFWVS